MELFLRIGILSKIRLLRTAASVNSFALVFLNFIFRLVTCSHGIAVTSHFSFINRFHRFAGQITLHASLCSSNRVRSSILFRFIRAFEIYSLRNLCFCKFMQKLLQKATCI